MNAGYILSSLSVHVGNWWPFEFVQLHYEDNYKVPFVMMSPAYENMLLRACHCHSSHGALRNIPTPKSPTS